jgi:hypothetical protein
MAMLCNFHPYGRKVLTKPPYALSSFEALNGFRYHDNWLRNLLIAASLNSMFKFLSEKITCNDKSKVSGFAENTTNIKYYP